MEEEGLGFEYCIASIYPILKMPAAYARGRGSRVVGRGCCRGRTEVDDRAELEDEERGC